jgi:hypothetical protein
MVLPVYFFGGGTHVASYVIIQGTIALTKF